MPRLKLWLLGSPRFERDGEPVELGRRKALALVIYLAVRRQAASRDELTALLWPEAEPGRGRTALRRVLSDLNKVLGKSWLDVAGDRVALPSEADLWVDVAAFRLALSTCQTHGHAPDVACAACVPLLAEAAALYRDDFLAGFTLPDCPAFDEWQFFEAESLRRELAGALARLVRHLLTAGSYEQAIPYARRWLGLDPLMEAPHAALMQLYARTGQRAAALRQYQEYLHVLAAELELPPDREMTALYERIRRGEEGPAAERGAQAGYGPLLSVLPSPVLGASLAHPEDEIRLVSVLCAGVGEVADSAGRSSLDELADAADALMQLVKQAVSRYEARVERFVGGSVQVVFGIPLAHEDDPERAIRAALEIQAAAQKKGLGVSIGISTGQVYFQSPGIESQEATMIGPVLNLASRLQGKAPPGEVLVSEATHRHTRRAFEFAPYESGVKGALEPTTAYLVRQVLLHPEKVRGVEGLHARLIGRDEELNRLRFALDAVLHGQGQIVCLIGEAGLGKSRLIAELKQVALAAQDYRAPLLWLESRCQELSMATSYWPFIDLLRTYLYLQVDDERDRAGALVTVLQEMVARGDLPAARREEIGALLGNLLSLRLENDWGERLKNVGPAQIRRQTFLAIFDFLVALSRQRPLVLVFEDLHWADDLSLDLISLLMESIPSSPIILLCAYRPQPGHKSHHLATIALQKCPACYTELRLRELTPAQSYRLLQALLTVENVPPAVQELVLNRSWGNPFFMEEIIRALVDSGALYRAEGQWMTAVGTGGSAVPESIQSVILSRVDRLSPGLRRVLRCAAVIGWLFPMEILAEVVPADIDLEQVLWALEDAALIYRERVVPEVEYAFRHVLIQEAVYQTLARQQRAELHAQVARVIERRYQDNLSEHYENLAYHYSRSANVEKAVEYLVKAGEKSRRVYFNEQAMDYFRQALDRLAELPHHAGPSGDTLAQAQLTALTGLGQICYILGKGSEAEHYFRRAIGVGREARVEIRELVRLYFWLAEVLHWQGRYNEQARLGETVLALLTEDEAETVEAALVNQTIAIASIHRDDHARFYELTDQTARFIRRLPYSEELWAPYAHITFSLYERKRIAEMNRWLEIIQHLADDHNDLRLLTIVYDHRGEYSFDRGDLAEASRNIGRALELYQTVGERVHIWRCLGGLVWIHLLQGDLSTAEGYARRALESAQTLGFDKFVAESYFNWGMVLLADCRWNEAVEAFELAERLAAGEELFWTQWAAPYGVGCVYLAQGKTREARLRFLAALASFFPRPVPLGWAQHRWWSLLAVILSGLESVCESAQAFEQACRPFESLKRQPAMPPLPAQWQFVPGSETVEPPPPGGFNDSFDGELLPGWTWRDPFGDGAFACRDGLEVRTPNGRDLWHLNRSAPCLLRASSGDFTLQAICAPANDSLPSIGGLVIWNDDDNFLRLVWGSRGRHEVSFEGCIGGQDVIVGRGWLPVDPSRISLPRQVVLRLERRGERVTALCSADGQQWFGVGQAAFAVSPNVEVGLHAVGWIDRTLYPGAFPAGTAIRFRAFQMWP